MEKSVLERANDLQHEIKRLKDLKDFIKSSTQESCFSFHAGKLDIVVCFLLDETKLKLQDFIDTLIKEAEAEFEKL